MDIRPWPAHRNTSSGNVINFPCSIVTGGHAIAARWNGAPVALVPAPVLASVWAARRLARENPVTAFAETLQRCRETIAAAKAWGRP